MNYLFPSFVRCRDFIFTNILKFPCYLISFLSCCKHFPKALPRLPTSQHIEKDLNPSSLITFNNESNVSSRQISPSLLHQRLYFNVTEWTVMINCFPFRGIDRARVRVIFVISGNIPASARTCAPLSPSSPFCETNITRLSF